jgi:hypothetical protein
VPATTLWQSDSLTVIDYRCDADRHVAPFVEQHGGFDLAYVRKGSFGYRTRGEAHELVAGSILIGHPGQEYVCTHEHVSGDECLSFQLAPELIESLGGAPEQWRAGTLPPLSELMVLGELAQAVASGASDLGLDEAGLAFAARFIDLLTERTRRPRGRRTRPPARGRRPSDRRTLDGAARPRASRARRGLSPFTSSASSPPSSRDATSVLERFASPPRRPSPRRRGPSITDVAYDVGLATSRTSCHVHRAAGVSPRALAKPRTAIADPPRAPRRSPVVSPAIYARRTTRGYNP